MLYLSKEGVSLAYGKLLFKKWVKNAIILFKDHEEGTVMNFTTLCYIEKENQYLMLHRVSKKKDGNKDKWIGVGGHFEEGESPEDCLLREVREETGLELVNYQFRGIVTFISDKWEDEYMCLYTADKYIGEIGVCDEGELVWVEKDKIKDLNIWEGDKIFLRLLAENEPFFSLKLEYQGENLINAILNGKEYNLRGCKDRK